LLDRIVIHEITENAITDRRRKIKGVTDMDRQLVLTAVLIMVTSNLRPLMLVGCKVVAMQIGVEIKIENTAASSPIVVPLFHLQTDLEQLLR
jgi:hypothetical protein